MWQTEHGRSGSTSGYDELNLVEKGKNYGWPTIQGPETAPGMVSPVLQSGATTTWAPSGMAYLNGSIYFSGLRGERLYKASITTQGEVSLFTEHFTEQFGRIRAVTVGPDGNLYLSTSNRDGRAEEKTGDDKILKVYPDFLQ
jgi:glucose/arabinose dehydrogenase